MKQNDRIIVAGVLISKDGKILMGKVRKGGVYPDTWHLPGGGVEDGEDKETALTREIREEVGIDIKNNQRQLLSDSDTGEAVKTDKDTGEKLVINMKFYVYQVSLNQDSQDIAISLNDDIEEYMWVAKGDLKNHKLTPPSVRLFKKLGWL
jgi:8-oxo-dGTP pyrophosphatase MutT (NUDIX family)